MRIREVSWENYRGLPDGRIEVRDHLVLVGPNDSGKTSIVRAVHLCLGLSHAQLLSAISLRDFTDLNQPLILSVTLAAIEPDDRAGFPDEITTGPPEVLVINVEASVDTDDPDQKKVRRYFPDAGHSRAPTKDQLKAIGFQYVSAVRSLYRELGGASGGAVRSLLSGLDLAADAAALEAAAESYQVALDGSTALHRFRKELAAALTAALPEPVAETDVRAVSESELLDDPLSGVTITVKDRAHDVPLAEQSDGVRALSVLTLLGMSHKSSRIVAIDEPETHLHPVAQRSLAKWLRSGPGQRVLVTHSPAVTAVMNTLDIVAFGADKRARQLPLGAPITEYEEAVRHWSPRLIEPLTARRIVVVEGVSDQIILERVAELTEVNLDRIGVAVFELDGAQFFRVAFNIFGAPGFDLPLAGMLDEDARGLWADTVGVNHADLEQQGYMVCAPDLEGEYIAALGVDAVIGMLLASPSLTEQSLLTSCGVAARADVTAEMLRKYCSRRKVPAALAVASALTPTQAASLSPVVQLLQLVS